MHRRVQILGWTLIWSGLFVIGYLGWQLLGTDVINTRVQAAAEVELGESLVETRQDLPGVEQIPTPGDPLETVEYHPEGPRRRGQRLPI